MITPVIHSHLNATQLKRLEEVYKRAAGSYTTIGIHQGKRGYAGTNAPTVGQVALWMEYGAPNANVPARPFLGPAMANNRPAIASLFGRNLALMAHNQMDVRDALTQVGQQAKLFIQAAIQSGPGPELSGSWDPPKGYLGRKRRLNQPSQTLIATGTLLASVEYRVVLGKAAQEQPHEDHGGHDSSGVPSHSNAERRAKERLKHALSRKKGPAQAGRDEHGRFIKRNKT